MASFIDRVLGTSLAGAQESAKLPEKDLMKAVVYAGSGSVDLAVMPRPRVSDPSDAVIRVTTASICGSDLHLYHNAVPGMKTGDILGHEFVGVVESVGADVQSLRPHRVVVSAVISCGNCWYCKHELFSCCDSTNPSPFMEERYGHRTSGMFGHSHVTGGYPGGQAEFVRVPFADVNCLCIPESLDDDKAVLLADVATTGFHACEMADVGDDLHRNVAVWGCGPVGLMAVMWAKARGATKVVAIDCVPYRLEMARRMGADVAVNFKEIKDVAAHVRDCFPPLGADACIEAVGFRYAKSWTHAVERTMALETDAIDTIDECVKACRKGGSISVVGDYMGSCNHFPIGAVMEKGLTLRSGQCHVQKYWKSLAALLARKEVDPSPIVSHKLPLSEAPRAYKLFDTKEDEAIKILLVP